MKLNENLSVLFLLEKNKMRRNGTAPLTARITVDGSRAEISLGKKLPPDCWDQEAELVKGPGATKELGVINKQIAQARIKLETLYFFLSSQQEQVTAAMLKKAYKGDPHEDKERVRTICQVANYKYSIFARQVKRKLRSGNTLKRWQCTKRKLRHFLQYKFGKWDVLLSAFKYAHAQDFMNYLTLQDGIEENSARKYIKNVKELLQIAADRGWLAGNPWANYRIGYDQPDRECLSMRDIMALYRKPLLDRLDHVRNIFLFACFTGYAFQEVQNLSPDDVFIGDDGKRWIKIDRRKTGRPECLPLLPIPASIIDRYTSDPYCKAHHRLLPVKSYQNYNSYLKEVGYLCGITIELSTHIARHTFATTITLDNDVPIETVSKMLGHKNIRTTQIYAKVSRKKISSNMDELERKLFTPDGELKFEVYNGCNNSFAKMVAVK
jgi:site-specific recombinase XerD